MRALAGLGLVGLLVATAIVLLLVSKQTEQLSNSGQRTQPPTGQPLGPERSLRALQLAVIAQPQANVQQLRYALSGQLDFRVVQLSKRQGVFFVCQGRRPVVCGAYEPVSDRSAQGQGRTRALAQQAARSAL